VGFDAASAAIEPSSNKYDSYVITSCVCTWLAFHCTGALILVPKYWSVINKDAITLGDFYKIPKSSASITAGQDLSDPRAPLLSPESQVESESSPFASPRERV
jgi:hypothetical protein